MTSKISDDHYQALVDAEKRIYQGDQPSASIASIFTYWASKFLAPRLRSMFGTDQIEMFFASEIIRVGKTIPGVQEIRILSLGSGECSLERDVAQHLASAGVRFKIHCTDISPEMLVAGKALVEAAGHAKNFEFIECDVNKNFPKGSWDVVIANHCLHHFVELEYIFSCVRASMDGGAFIVSDMIGRNGHMRWPETLDVVEAFWNTLPPPKRFDRIHKTQQTDYVNFNCAEGTFEGIRAQDILPLMAKTFHFERFLGYGGIPDIFVDRIYGGNFDCNNNLDTAFIDCLQMVNDKLSRAGLIKPTMMFAVVRRNKTGSEIFDPVRAIDAVRTPE
jgi:SAM-dependent methyltransferase